MTVKIFAYGTLRGMTVGKVLKHDDSVKATAISLGSFPAVVSLDGPYDLEGDVIEITDDMFRQLDKYEGYPKLYTRKQITTEDGHLVWIYMFNQILKRWAYPGGQPDVQFVENSK